MGRKEIKWWLKFLFDFKYFVVCIEYFFKVFFGCFDFVDFEFFGLFFVVEFFIFFGNEVDDVYVVLEYWSIVSFFCEFYKVFYLFFSMFFYVNVFIVGFYEESFKYWFYLVVVEVVLVDVVVLEFLQGVGDNFLGKFFGFQEDFELVECLVFFLNWEWDVVFDGLVYCWCYFVVFVEGGKYSVVFEVFVIFQFVFEFFVEDYVCFFFFEVEYFGYFVFGEGDVVGQFSDEFGVFFVGFDGFFKEGFFCEVWDIVEVDFFRFEYFVVDEFENLCSCFVEFYGVEVYCINGWNVYVIGVEGYNVVEWVVGFFWFVFDVVIVGVFFVYDWVWFIVVCLVFGFYCFFVEGFLVVFYYCFVDFDFFFFWDVGYLLVENWDEVVFCWVVFIESFFCFEFGVVFVFDGFFSYDVVVGFFVDVFNDFFGGFE